MSVFLEGVGVSLLPTEKNDNVLKLMTVFITVSNMVHDTGVKHGHSH